MRTIGLVWLGALLASVDGILELENRLSYDGVGSNGNQGQMMQYIPNSYAGSMQVSTGGGIPDLNALKGIFRKPFYRSYPNIADGSISGGQFGNPGFGSNFEASGNIGGSGFGINPASTGVGSYGYGNHLRLGGSIGSPGFVGNVGMPGFGNAWTVPQTQMVCFYCLPICRAMPQLPICQQGQGPSLSPPPPPSLSPPPPPPPTLPPPPPPTLTPLQQQMNHYYNSCELMPNLPQCYQPTLICNVIPMYPKCINNQQLSNAPHYWGTPTADQGYPQVSRSL